MLTTLLKPMAGTVTVFGTDAAAHPMRVRRMIGYVPQLLSADAPSCAGCSLALRPTWPSTRRCWWAPRWSA
jgi:ABC-type Mn2+/Zn2+ transport system ATPase subunit